MDVVELDGAANGNVESIQSLIDGARWSPNELKRKVYIIDECLDGRTRINTENGLLYIRDIVNKKLEVNVLSYNQKTNNLEYKPVTGWFKNSGKNIYKLSFESEGRVYASGRHLISTPDGYKKVEDIAVGDLVYRMGIELTDEQKQLVYGSLLGDASISKNKNRKIMPRGTNARIRFVHGKKQKEYLSFKHKIIGGSKPRRYFHKGFEDYDKIETWRFNTVCSSQFTNIYGEVTKKEKKNLNIGWLNKVKWMGMAFWFCDDGSITNWKNATNDGYMVTFHTQGFSYDKQLVLMKWLKTMKMSGSILHEERNGKILFRIGLNKRSSIILLNKIWKYIPECMDYKLKGFRPNILESKYRYEFTKKPQEHSIISERLTSKDPMGYKEVTYDIEVKDNHNYFASQTLVHNCHQLSSKAISALLKIVEEPPSYLTFIFCTTDPKKVIDTIPSRSQRFNFRRLLSKEIVGRMRFISDKEEVNITDEALFAIAKISRGCMRDAVVILEQIATQAGKNKIDENHIQKYFGLPDRQIVFQIVNAMTGGNISLLMDQVNDLIMANADTEAIAYEISEAFRTLMLLKAQNGQVKCIDLPDHEIEQLKKIGELVKLGQLDKMSKQFSTLRKELEYSINERWVLESTLIHCTALLKQQA